jgi:RNA polymerase sigma-70 factor (ECF subfamily)
MIDERNDGELISEVLRGDDALFEVLLDRYLSAAYGFAYRLVNNKSDAEDIVQDSFLKAWKALKQYNPEKKFITWLLAIVRNTALDHLRKKRTVPFSAMEMGEDAPPIEETLVDENDLPDETFRKVEDKLFAESLLEKLPILYREVVVLRYQEDMDFKEIGEALGRPVETVKSQHHRAMRMLREQLSNAPE